MKESTLPPTLGPTPAPGSADRLDAMTTTDYVINIALVLVVVRQIRGGLLTLQNLMLPIVLIGAAAAYFLRSFPTAGNDLTLELVLASAGAVLGALCGLATHLTRESEGVFAKAGVIAAVLWIGGIGARMAFAYASDHGYGASIAKFSRDNDITSSAAWVAAFVLMALVQATARLAVIQIRAARLRADDRLPAGAAA
jgi:hypothetical protein